MNIDIQAGITAAVLLAVIFFLISLISGIRTILSGREIKFFRIRRDQMMRGWRLILLGIFWVLLGLGALFYGEPVAYHFITPSPTLPITLTPSLSPTISTTPTITMSPTITLTPAESYTPTASPTPYLPLAVEARFQGVLTPPPDAAFSTIEFSNVGLDEEYNPIGPGINFTNPVGHMYGVFSYAGMADDVQWTALWLRDGNLVHFETLPWDGGSGGIGYTEWDPAAEMWLPGSYEVQLFLGSDYYLSSTFSVEGEPPTPTKTPTAHGHYVARANRLPHPQPGADLTAVR